MSNPEILEEKKEDHVVYDNSKCNTSQGCITPEEVIQQEPVVIQAEAKKNKKIKKNILFQILKRLWFWCLCAYYKIKNWLFRNSNPIFKRGTHIITGYMGSGKTLLVNKVINSVNPNKYYFITNVNEFKQENVYHHDIWDLFTENSQVKKLPTVDEKGRKLYGLILDEINLKFNRRLNKTKNYNEKFVGLIEMIITCRHQGINRIYFIGQKLELQDSQLQSLFKYWHNILMSNQKGIWPYYKLENRFVLAPKKIIYENWRKYMNDEYEQIGFTKVKITFKDLTTYNTFGMKPLYDKLPTQARFNYTPEFRKSLKENK